MKELKVRGYYLRTRMRFFICFFGVFFLISCTSSNTIYKEPEDLIPKDSMEMLLVDMYLAGGANNVRDKCGKKIKNYLPFVYEKYKIDSTRFYNSNYYYTSKIEDYKGMLTNVKDVIEKEFNFFETELGLRDSLKKAKKKQKLLNKKLKDSIKIAEKSKDYIPWIIRVFKIDTTYFYKEVISYPSNEMDYNHIINEIKEKDKSLDNEDEEGADIDKDSIEALNEKKVK